MMMIDGNLTHPPDGIHQNGSIKKLAIGAQPIRDRRLSIGAQPIKDRKLASGLSQLKTGNWLAGSAN